MFLLKKPSAAEIAKFISASRDLPFSYREVEASQGDLPLGYNIDHNRTKLGVGKDVFDQAVASLKEWRQFDLGWISIVPPAVPLETGAVVAVLAKHFGFWSLNACRVVYLINEDGPSERFGFAYGTLSNHVERGEERFMIERLGQDDSVWYDILAFSRPNQLLIQMGFVYARRLQKRFARDSMAVMRSICKG